MKGFYNKNVDFDTFLLNQKEFHPENHFHRGSSQQDSQDY